MPAVLWSTLECKCCLAWQNMSGNKSRGCWPGPACQTCHCDSAAGWPLSAGGRPFLRNMQPYKIGLRFLPAHFHLTCLCRDGGESSSGHKSRCSAAAAAGTAASSAASAGAGCSPGADSPGWAGHAAPAVPVPHADGSATHDQCHPDLSTHSSWGGRWRWGRGGGRSGTFLHVTQAVQCMAI